MARFLQVAARPLCCRRQRRRSRVRRRILSLAVDQVDKDGFI